ncbi:MAG: tetratricopeptide repeat protein [Anaerolineae bacterium]|nr:tetratricopeptide repeat protein [Anaerolineae bacterium]
MADLNLRAYLEYIQSRLASDAFSEVIAQCRHILEVYPKHLATYRLMARALLARDEHQDALDIFQRVLSSDPNDFVAHIGMSDCYRELGAIDQAIWHLERAFEQAPNNSDLKEEIRRLYAQRGGQAPRTIQLTGGALARMYTNGGLHQQAIAEIRKAVANDPERLDLQVLLADALWAAHREVEAGKVASEVLKKLPYSVDANRVLARLWLRAGDARAAQPFLDRVKELDPYLWYDIAHEGQQAPGDVFRMDMLQYTPESRATGSASSWVAEITGIEKNRGVTGPLSAPGTKAGAQPPSWLDEALNAAPAPLVPPAPAPAPVPAASTVPDIPDWLKEEVPPVPTPTAPVPAPPAVVEASAPAADQPDWLKEVLLEDTPTGVNLPVREEPPDWLQDVLDGTDKAAPPAPTFGQDSLPPWMVEPETAAPPVEGIPARDDSAEVASIDNDLPAWLKPVEEAGQTGDFPSVQSDDMLTGLSSGMPFSAAQAVQSGESVRDAALPDTPRPAASSAERVPLARQEGDRLMVPPDDATPDSDVPDWLQSGDLDSDDAVKWLEELAAKYDPNFKPSGDVADTAASEPPVSASEDLDWLRTPSESAASVPEPAPPSSPAPATAAEPEDIPDWLKETPAEPLAVPAPAAQEEEEELPDWLKPPAAAVEPVTPAEPEAAPEPMTPMAMPLSAAEEEEELPDWLKATPLASAPAETAPAGEEEELPDWLKATPAAAISVTPEAAAEEEELPDWLKPPAEVPQAVVPEPAALQPEPAAPDAMTWLDEQVAAQGVEPGTALAEALTPDHAPLPEMPGPRDLDAAAEAVEEDELPDWLKDVGEKTPEPVEAAVSDLEEAEGVDEELAWLDGAIASETASELDYLFGDAKEATPAVAEPVAAEPASAAAAAEEEEELPDWLKEPETSLPVSAGEDEELPDWLKAPVAPEPVVLEPVTPETEPVEPAPSLTGWLETREPAEPVAPEPVPLEPVAEAVPPARATGLLPDYPAVSGEATDFVSVLNTARQQLAGEETDAALGSYEKLIGDGQMINETISDLTRVAGPPSATPRFRRVLGDAYMAQGSLEQALEMYRAALDQL